MEKLVIGLVQTHDEAEAAAERIIDCGYTRQEVSLLMTEATRHRCFPEPGCGRNASRRRTRSARRSR